MRSADVSPKPRDATSLTSRTYGYVRASPLEEFESPEVQARIIATDCLRTGRRLDELFVDDALSYILPLSGREEGKRLLMNLQKGDHLVVARSDLMFRSPSEFWKTLDERTKLGVTVDPCDLPMRFEPESTLSRLAIDLIVRSNASRSRTISTRCKDTCYHLKAEGKRSTCHAPYGFRWEERGPFSYMVPEPAEQEICIRAAELK